MNGAVAGGLTFVLGLMLPIGAGAVDRTAGSDVAKPTIGGVPWTDAGKTRLARDLDALLDGASTLRGAHTGLLAVDTGSGQVVYARKSDDAFVPASTLKLVTGSAALALLGPNFRFHTEAYLGSPNQTLYLKAGGDPLLAIADVAAFTRAAVAAGFRPPFATAIDANGFDADPYPPGWSWDDFVYDYAPQLAPVPVSENALQLSVSPGKFIGAAPVVAELPAIDTSAPEPIWGRCTDRSDAVSARQATTAAADVPVTLDVVRSALHDCFEIVGSVPLGGETQTLGVARVEPTAYLCHLIRRFAARGVEPPRLPRLSSSDAAYQSIAVPPEARSVWMHDGEPLADLLADMWLPSDNLIAEMLLREIGLRAADQHGTTANGLAAERSWLIRIGIDPAFLTLADGSGLSAYDRISPRALVALLQADWNGPNRDIVLDDLPIAGVRGTLQGSFRGTLAQGRTFAKTGTVNHARGLAGYLATLHHGAVTFAWSVDDWLGSPDDLAALRARVLSRLIGD